MVYCDAMDECDNGRQSRTDRRRPEAAGLEPEQGALPEGGFHQGAGDRLLHPHRARAAAASEGPAADDEALPERRRREFFYEKNCPSHRPGWVKTAKVWSHGNQRDMHYCLAQDLPTLVWAANLADLELHTSLARKKDVAKPTMMVFDLDPGPPADIVQCCQVGLLAARSC